MWKGKGKSHPVVLIRRGIVCCSVESNVTIFLYKSQNSLKCTMQFSQVIQNRKRFYSITDYSDTCGLLQETNLQVRLNLLDLHNSTFIHNAEITSRTLVTNLAGSQKVHQNVCGVSYWFKRPFEQDFLRALCSEKQLRNQS